VAEQHHAARLEELVLRVRHSEQLADDLRRHRQRQAATRSAGGPPASIASIRSFAICWMRGRSRCTRRVVNSPMTARRATVWSGGSMPISDAPRPRARRSAGVTVGRRAPAGRAASVAWETTVGSVSGERGSRQRRARVVQPRHQPGQHSAGQFAGSQAGRRTEIAERRRHAERQARGSGRWTSGGSCIAASPRSG